jgi:hypothetical protein
LRLNRANSAKNDAGAGLLPFQRPEDGRHKTVVLLRGERRGCAFDRGLIAGR